MQDNGRLNEKDIRDNKVMAAMAYLGILVAVPYFMAKESRFARYHAKQGITLFVAEVAYSILYQIFVTAILMVSWRFYYIVRIFGYLALEFPILAIVGIIDAINGQEKELPVIGKIRLFR